MKIRLLNTYTSSYQYSLNSQKPIEAKEKQTFQQSPVQISPLSYKNYFIPFFGHNINPQRKEILDKSVYTNAMKEAKETINNMVVTPLSGKDDVTTPSFLVFYSPDQEIQDMFVKETIEKLADKCRIATIDANSSEEINNALKQELARGRKTYLETGKKSFVVINNAHKFTHAEKAYLEELTKTIFGKSKPEKYKDLPNDLITAELKGLADTASSLPKSPSEIAYATTILLNGENMFLLDRDLQKRPGKCQTIAINFPNAEAYSEIIKKAVEKQISTLEKLKTAPLNKIENSDLPYEVIDKLRTLKNNYYISTLYISTYNLPYNVLGEYAASSLNGAFKAGQIEEISKNALYEFIKNPNLPFHKHFFNIFFNTPKAITPQELEECNDACTYMNRQQKKNSELYKKNLRLMAETVNAAAISKEIKKEIIESYIDDNNERLYLENQKRTRDLTQKEAETLKFLEKATFNDNSTENLGLKNIIDAEIKERLLNPEDGKYKFHYGSKEEDSVDLYIGGFGKNTEVLWVDSSDLYKINTIKFFIQNLKSCSPFENIKLIEFASDKINEDDEDYQKTERVSIDYLPIYQIALED